MSFLVVRGPVESSFSVGGAFLVRLNWLLVNRLQKGNHKPAPHRHLWGARDDRGCSFALPHMLPEQRDGRHARHAMVRGGRLVCFALDALSTSFESPGEGVYETHYGPFANKLQTSNLAMST